MWNKIDYKNCASRWSLTYYVYIIFSCNLFSCSNDIEFVIRIINFVEGLFARYPIVLCSFAP